MTTTQQCKIKLLVELSKAPLSSVASLLLVTVYVYVVWAKAEPLKKVQAASKHS